MLALHVGAIDNSKLCNVNDSIKIKVYGKVSINNSNIIIIIHIANKCRQNETQKFLSEHKMQWFRSHPTIQHALVFVPFLTHVCAWMHSPAHAIHPIWIRCDGVERRSGNGSLVFQIYTCNRLFYSVHHYHVVFGRVHCTLHVQQEIQMRCTFIALVSAWFPTRTRHNRNISSLPVACELQKKKNKT